jgi:hypothetical protein
MAGKTPIEKFADGCPIRIIAANPAKTISAMIKCM